MAGSSLFTAILDANVLYPAPLRDVLLSLAAAGLFHARWTSDIANEWQRNLIKNRPELADQLPKVAAAMERAIPDCLITSHTHLIDSLQLPDLGDRHVLAAAIAGHADAIVTFNLKDFPAAILAEHNIEAMHPDDFVMHQLELRHIEALTALKNMRARLNKPPYSPQDFISLIERNQLPLTASFLRQVASLI
ncbi:PIN domain-containing protein [Chitinivorax sp. B]|uniref:PIN domain-containing protein n=1 Tax=Chitinivorax sp. B TaxID=2502235 RepID=UPI0010F92474|nr:PIN domain-containing protein [Chitinivorax sp. B]